MTEKNHDEKKLTAEEREELLRRRAERFTWKPDDLVFYGSREEVEKAAAKESRKVVWY